MAQKLRLALDETLYFGSKNWLQAHSKLWEV